MANTNMIAKNTFGEGLVMDFAPDNTQANVLTSALNATLLTFNGNEMSLQNDMGNGRVETARLPEGYIPVGSCEFGDIIYIVSYNPLINKSQIGCFPSPERNISSEEIGSREANISYKTFQETQNNIPNGKILTNSVKYVLFDKSLNPGDKYIINYNGDLGNEGEGLEENKMLSDLGNTSKTYGTFPKLLKLHVVSIEDSGKITFLDNTVKWYDNKDLPYFIINSIRDATSNKLDKKDLDAYRSLVSSEYSIFQSKVSGKLAILAELEKINGFSCTYAVYPETEIVGKIESICRDNRCEAPTVKVEVFGSKEQTASDLTISSNNRVNTEKIVAKQYHVFFDINWETEDPNINPKYIVLTKSNWNNQTSYISLDKPIASKALILIPDENNYTYPVFNMSDDVDKYSFKLEGWKEPKLYNYRTQEGWYSEISRQYKPELFIGTYKDFQEKDSYQAKLDSFLKDLNVLSSTTKSYKLVNSLTTLNDLNYTATYPNEGNYYINVAGYMMNDGESIPFTYNQNNELVTITNPITITDDIVNNFFKTSVLKNFARFIIPTKYYQIEEFKDNKYTKEYNFDNSNLIYNYTIAPAMPYGILDEYAIDGCIDFSKINSGDINLTGWKYYNTDNVSTLGFSIEAYPEPNKGISEVVLEFYDNQGIAAAYHITGRKSYSGSFTEYIPLNDPKANYKLNNIDAHGNIIKHAGIKYNGDDANSEDLVTIEGSDIVEDGIYYNDAGTIYSNVLYLVKVVIKYCNINSIGQFESDYNSNIDYSDTTYYRWFWTNKMYNDRYFDTSDFNSLSFNLALSAVPLYNSKEDYLYDIFNYESNSPKIDSVDKNLQAIVQRIIGHVSVKFSPVLINNYNCFLLNKTNVENLNYTLYDGDLKVEFSKEDINILHSNSNHSVETSNIQPISSNLPIDTKYGNTLNKHYLSIFNMVPDDDIPYSEIWENNENYKDSCNIYLEEGLILDNEVDCVSEINLERTDTSGLPSIRRKFGENIDINLDIINFSKYYTEVNMVDTDVNVYKPAVYSADDLNEYNLKLESDGHVYFQKLLKTRIYSNNTESHSVSRWSLEDVNLDGTFNVSVSNEKVNRQEIEFNASFSQLGKKEGDSGVYKVDGSFVDTEKFGDTKMFLFGYNRDKISLDSDQSDNDTIILNTKNKPYSEETKYLYSTGITLPNYSNVIRENIKLQSIDTTNFFGRTAGSASSSSDYANLMVGFKGDSNDNIHILNTAFPSIISGNKLTLNFKVPVMKLLDLVQLYDGDGYIYLLILNSTIVKNLNDLYSNFELYNVSDLYSPNSDEEVTAVSILGAGYSVGSLKRLKDLLNDRRNEGIEIYAIPETGYRINFNRNNDQTLCIGEIEKLNDNTIKTKVYKGGYIDYNLSITTNPLLIKGFENSFSDFTKIVDIDKFNWNKERYLYQREGYVDYCIGDMVASVLSNIYINKGMEPTLIPLITDTAYLENYVTYYKKEFICNVNLNNVSDQNQLIIIGDKLSYSKYLESILNNLEDEEQNKVSRSNVNVLILSSVLTHPFIIQMEYKTPSSKQLSVNINSKVYVPGKDPMYLQIDGNDSDLYTLSDNNLEKLKQNNFKCTYYNKRIQNEQGIIIPDVNVSNLISESNTNIWNVFKLENGKLISKFSDGVLSLYGISFVDDQGNATTSIRDLLQQDILIPSLTVIEL